MSFHAWLTTQTHRNDLVGEIAQQVARRDDFPKAEALVCFRVFLAKDEATPLALRAIEIAYEEWVRSRDLPAVNALGDRFHTPS